MSRLTNKDDRGRYYTVEEKILIANEPVNPTTTWIVHNENRRYGRPIDKLGKLEDLEEQLGCPLMTVFKALQNGVYYEDVTNCMKYMAVDLHLNLEGEYVLYFSNEEYLLTKNYKKTWWLKEDRSE